MFGRFRKNYQKEDGAYMVITALLLTAIIGFMVLAVDQGSWLSQKRTEQNAVDAAAVAAAEAYANGGSGDRATAAALNAANQNGIVATASDLMITPDNAADPKKVKAVLTLDADNYFYNNGKAKNKTAIVVTSEAQIYEEQTSGGSYIINPAIEAKQFTWSSGISANTTIQGDIATSDSIVFDSPASVNGNINADGEITMKSNLPFTVHGNVNSKTDILVTTSNTVEGNLESLGNIKWSRDDGHVSGSVRANGNVSLNKMIVDGNVESHGGIITFLGPNGTVHGHILSDTGVSINGGSYPHIVDGIFYKTNLKLEDYQKNGMKKSNGDPTDFRDYNGEKVTPVTHQDYTWKWDSLLKTPDIAYHITAQDLKDFACSDEIVKQYGKWAWIGGGIPQVGTDGWADPNSLQFKNANVFQQFIQFVKNKIGSTTTPIYFPGRITVNNETGIQAKVEGFIVAQEDINWWAPCDFTGNNGTSFISINGNIDLQGDDNTNINGVVAVLNKDRQVKLEVGNNNPNGTATIKGGVISHGNIVMNGDWSIIADTSWQQYVPIEGGTKTVKKVKLIS